MYCLSVLGLSILKLFRIQMWYSIFKILKYSNHNSPTNSLSATKQSIHSLPKRLMNHFIKSIISCVLEFHFLSIIENNNGKTTPLYTISNMKVLISVWTNLQLVLSILNINFSFKGSKLKISLATRSGFKWYSAINRWIIRKKDSGLT